jgi:hypothetical protein
MRRMNKMIDWHQYLLESPSLHTILRKMCSYVDKGLIPYDLKTWTNNWYHKYTWREEQQESFIKWTTNYLYNNTQARKEILGRNVMNKKLIEDSVRWFVFLYGWKVKK